MIISNISFILYIFLYFYLESSYSKLSAGLWLCSFLFLYFANSFLSGTICEISGRWLEVRTKRGQLSNQFLYKRNLIIGVTVLSFILMLFMFLKSGVICDDIFSFSYLSISFVTLIPFFLFYNINQCLTAYLRGETFWPASVGVLVIRAIGMILISGGLRNTFLTQGMKIANFLGQDYYKEIYLSANLSVGILLTEIFLLMLLIGTYFIYRKVKPLPRDLRSELQNGFHFGYYEPLLKGNIMKGISLFPFIILLCMIVRKAATPADFVSVYGELVYFTVLLLLTLASVSFLLTKPINQLGYHLRKEDTHFSSAALHKGFQICLYFFVYILGEVILLKQVFYSIFDISDLYKTTLSVLPICLFTAFLWMFFSKAVYYWGKKNLVFIISAIKGIALLVMYILLLTDKLTSMTIFLGLWSITYFVCFLVLFIFVIRTGIRYDFVKALLVPIMYAAISIVLLLILSVIFKAWIATLPGLFICNFLCVSVFVIGFYKKKMLKLYKRYIKRME